MPSARELTNAVQRIAPGLRAAGWKRFATTFNRSPEPGLVHVINFQGNKWGGRFTVNLGIYVLEIDRLFDDWWSSLQKDGDPGRGGVVREDVCWLRQRLGRLGPSAGDVWWAYDAIEASINDIELRLSRDAVPALEQASTRARLVRAWQSGEIGRCWRIDPRAPIGYAILLNGAGRADEAQQVMEEVRRRARGTPFFRTATYIGQQLGFNFGRATRLTMAARPSSSSSPVVHVCFANTGVSQGRIIRLQA